MLETITQFVELMVLELLSDDLDKCDFICNQALDVRSAIMVYLVVCIYQNSIRSGILGIFYLFITPSNQF